MEMDKTRLLGLCISYFNGFIEAKVDFGELAGINKHVLEYISVNVTSLLANLDLLTKKQLFHVPGVGYGAYES